MSDKIIIKADSLKEAIELFIELQRKHPTRTVEVYVRGSDNNER